MSTLWRGRNFSKVDPLRGWVPPLGSGPSPAPPGAPWMSGVGLWRSGRGGWPSGERLGRGVRAHRVFGIGRAPEGPLRFPEGPLRFAEGLGERSRGIPFLAARLERVKRRGSTGNLATFAVEPALLARLSPARCRWRPGSAIPLANRDSVGTGGDKLQPPGDALPGCNLGGLHWHGPDRLARCDHSSDLPCGQCVELEDHLAVARDLCGWRRLPEGWRESSPARSGRRADARP